MPTEQPDLLSTLMPMILVAIPMMILSIIIAKRKGKSRILFAIFGMLPIINFIALIYLVSLTDKEVIDKLNVIIEKLNK